MLSHFKSYDKNFEIDFHFKDTINYLPRVSQIDSGKRAIQNLLSIDFITEISNFYLMIVLFYLPSPMLYFSTHETDIQIDYTSLHKSYSTSPHQCSISALMKLTYRSTTRPYTSPILPPNLPSPMLYFSTRETDIQIDYTSLHKSYSTSPHQCSISALMKLTYRSTTRPYTSPILPPLTNALFQHS